MAQTSQVRLVVAIECGQKATEGGVNRSGHAVCPLGAKRRQRERIAHEQEERSGLSCLSGQVMQVEQTVDKVLYPAIDKFLQG